MNIIEVILKERSLATKDKICAHVGKNPARFRKLVEVFFKGPYRVTQRAAWPLSYCVEYHPELVKPHLRRLVNNLKTPGIHNSVKRNTIRLLQYVNIPKSLQGTVVDVCFDSLSNPKESIAVRVFSMAVLANIARKETDLQNELRVLLEDQLPYASPAFASRAGKILREIKGLSVTYS